MANVTNGNSVFIDSTGDLDIKTNKNIKVMYIVVTANGGAALLDLEDNQASSVDKISLGIATDGDSKVFDFSRRPLVFPNGIEVTVATNVKATLLIDGSA